VPAHVQRSDHRFAFSDDVSGVMFVDIVGLQHVPSDDFHHLPAILFRLSLADRSLGGGEAKSGLWCKCNMLTKSARLPISVIRAGRIFSPRVILASRSIQSR
jgi:hypothetical protein